MSDNHWHEQAHAGIQDDISRLETKVDNLPDAIISRLPCKNMAKAIGKNTKWRWVVTGVTVVAIAIGGAIGRIFWP